MKNTVLLLAALSGFGTLALMGCKQPTVADLTVSATLVPSTAVHASTVWPLGVTIANQGTANAPASTIQYWFSSDPVLDSGDTLVRSSPVPVLPPSTAYVDPPVDHSVSQWGAGSGTHHIFVVADAFGVVTESNKTNNTSKNSVAVYYDRVIIDTYNATGGFGTADTFLSLFGTDGDPTADTNLTLWNSDAAPYTVDPPPISIDEDDDGNPFPTYTPFARIDYSDGLVPGTYYIKVRGKKSTETGRYAIRVLTDINPLDQYPAGWYFATGNDTDVPYETDDNPKSGGVPANPVTISIGQKHNRSLQAAEDVDWFVLTLP